MSTDDPAGYLPPHELRGLIASLDEPRISPGLATAAATPSPLAPTLPPDDPGALAIAIARVAGEALAPTVVIPLHGPELPSPGISPRLVADFPEPLAKHGDELVVPLVPDAQTIPPLPAPTLDAPAPPAVWSGPPPPSSVDVPGLPSPAMQPTLPED